MKFLNTLKSIFNAQQIKQLEIANEVTIQQVLANDLRQLSLNNLEEGQGVVAKSFRGEYINVGNGPYSEFIQQQSKPNTWGTYIEATSLGEKLGCHVMVTPVNNGNQQKPICLYRATDENAPTIHLYNSNNTHWYVNAKTKGDGNCLFNAFAQAIQQTVQPVLQKEATVKEIAARAQHSNQFFNQLVVDKRIDHAIHIQRNIEASIIKSHPKPADLEAMHLNEMQRISQLPETEQHQIQTDYALALKLATSELAYVHHNITTTKKMRPNSDKSFPFSSQI